LGQADMTAPMPPNVLVDSGGAPLSTTAVMEYRDCGIDLREGQGSPRPPAARRSLLD
jgi:hypothetical protein